MERYYQLAGQLPDQAVLSTAATMAPYFQRRMTRSSVTELPDDHLWLRCRTEQS